MSESSTPSAPAGGDAAEAYCSQCGRSFPAGTPQCPFDEARLVQLAAERDELIGKVLDGRFRVRAPLGEGGMGTVYVGTQLSIDREVAIKVIHPRLAGDRAVVKRFLREARLASRLNQPSIVNVIDSGVSSDGVLYLVMELLRGHTLASELGRGRRLAARRTCAIAIQLCDALEAAHAHDIVHRDLNPRNIILLDDPPGRDLVKVLDFGLAKSLTGEEPGSRVTTDVGGVLGTPLYMAPEQIEGRTIDPRTDLYALGCILYAMLAGEPPFTDPAVSAILARHIADAPAALPDHVPSRLRALVDRLLAKDPASRPQAAGEVRATLQRIAEATPPAGIAIVAPSPHDTVPMVDVADDVSPPARAVRRRSWLAVAVALAVVLGGGVAMWRVLGHDDPHAPAAAPDAAIAQVPPAPVVDATAAIVIEAAIPRVAVDAPEAPAVPPPDAAPRHDFAHPAQSNLQPHVTHVVTPPLEPPPPAPHPDAGVNINFVPVR